MMKFAKSDCWRRMKKVLRAREHNIGVTNLHLGMTSGTNRTINYINGYMAASAGKDMNDYSNPPMNMYNIFTVDWRAGFYDFKSGKEMSPLAHIMKVLKRE